MKRLIIISNRLPVNITEKNNKLIYSSSAGGLATGLSSVEMPLEMHWIGWPGIYPETDEKKKEIENELGKKNIHPVFLTPEEIQFFYEGYSNSTIWPLFHYFYIYTQFDNNFWKFYSIVNTRFLEKARQVVLPDDLIWVHDYQLMLLPGMLREAFPSGRIGYFLHIPFPSYELFRVLPERKELLEGLLGADLIGFHTFEYMRHFTSSVYRILGLELNINEIIFKNRPVVVDNFPMGINYDLYHNSSSTASVSEQIEKYTRQFRDKQIIFSVDRLDYSKGILHRLQAYDLLLEKCPEYRNNVMLILLVVPSRGGVEKYRDLKTRIDEYAGYINGKYSDINWVPVMYMYRSLSVDRLNALYYIADVALITPLRDGMNLVAKEYVAAKKGRSGVLILSEMTGSYIELTDALPVNPNNIDEIAHNLRIALNMPEDEKASRIKKMQAVVSKQTNAKWTNDFIVHLEDTVAKSRETGSGYIDDKKTGVFIDLYKAAGERLFILDYDSKFDEAGAKVSPSNATEEKLKNVINRLSSSSSNKVVIISAKTRKFLEMHFPHSGLIIVAEHGSFIRNELEWKDNIINGDSSWKHEITDYMMSITERTPGSYIEIREASVAWHYAKTDLWLADLRSRQLYDMLVNPVTRLNLQIVRGNRSIEVVNTGIDKGSAVERIISSFQADFILAAGGDLTDEEMFTVLPEHSITIKVGGYSKKSGYFLHSYNDLIRFLERISE